MKKILITGVNGLIGQAIGKVLLKQKGFKTYFTGIAACRIANFKQNYVELDISNKNQVEFVIGKLQPDVIINCAAISHVDVCEENPELCNKVNVFGVQNMVDVIQLRNNIKLIHLSSDFVFSGEKLNYVESDIPNPISAYGISKLDGEKIIQQNLSDYQIIRTVLVYGFGEALSRNNILTWVYQSLKQNKSISVVNDQFRTPTYVEDLAEGIKKLVEKSEVGIFHISGSEPTSIYNFAKSIAKIFGFNEGLISSISSNALNEKGKRPPKTGFNLQKVGTLINFQPKSIIDGLSTAKNQLTSN